ncbi:restriction endonuclease subunit S [Streptomyces sp. NPDC054861]
MTAGALPQGWRGVVLGDVASISRGASPRPIASPRWFSDTSDVGWVRISDLGRSDGLTLESTTQRLSPDGIARSRFLPPGTLILSIAATVGVPIITAIPACIHDGFVSVENLKGIDQTYLFYVLKAAQDELRTAGQTGSQSNINSEIVRRLPVALPPLGEQRAIVDALRDSDQVVIGLKHLIAKKQQVKQGMVQQFFDGATRAPVGGNGARAEREEQQLGKLLLRSPRYGINAAAVPLTSRTPTYIRITDIDDSGRFSPKVGVSHPKSDDYRLSQGELVFARTGASVGKSYLYDPRDGELVYAGFLINIAPDPQVLNPAYFALFAQTKGYWDWVARTSVRSGQPGINGREFAQLPIYVPEIEEQNVIASVVSEIDAEITTLGRRLDKARLIKDAMARELLTGRMRLPVDERAS